MAETSGFFDAEELVGGGYDREYVAEQWANYFKLFISNGVFVTPTNQLKVVSNSGMTVTVLPGWAWINGYWYNNSANYTLTVPANTSAATKKHGIFVQFDSGERIIKLVVGNERTTVNRTAPYYELKLAEITVAPGVSAITTADITDTRGNSSVCGFVTGVVDVIDTGDLFAQFTAIFNNFLTASQTSRIQDEAAFNTWFDAMKGQLTTDAAGHLQTEIDDLEEALTGEVVDSEPYVLRQGLGNLADMSLVGGSIAWNQLVQNGNFASTSNWNNVMSTFSVSNNVGKFTASAQWGRIQISNSVNYKANHIYLGTVAITGTTDTYFDFSGGISARYCHGSSREVISALVKPSSDANGNPAVGDRRTSGWTEVKVENMMIFDLTQMFGSTIADYIYSLEQATAGAGVAWFRQYFPNAYYAYNVGEIKSVNPSSRKVVGKNLLKITANSSTVNGVTYTINPDGTIIANGTATAGTTLNLTNGFVSFPSGTYIITGSVNSNARVYANPDRTQGYYDNGNGSNPFSVTSELVARIQVESGTTLNNTVFKPMIRFVDVEDDSFEPYQEIEYAFDTSKQLRGIPKLVNNKLSYDGDIYRADGSVTRKYGIVDLGSLAWIYTADWNGGSVISTPTNTINSANPSNIVAVNAISAKYGIVSREFLSTNPTAKALAVNESKSIIVRDSAYSDAATFKAAMSGVYLVYELATPTTESANPYQNPQRAFIDGTEEFVDYGVYHNDRDVAIPVGIDARYYLSEVLPAAEDYTDGAVELINTVISALQGNISSINTAITALNAMYNGKAPSITNNLNTLLAVGGKKFSVYGFNPSTTTAPTTASGLVFTWSFDSYNGAQLVIAEDNVYYRKKNSGSIDSWQTTDFVTNLEQTKSLSTSTDTAYTFSSSMINANSVIDVYTSIFGVTPSDVSVGSGSCTVTFPPYTSAASMKCRIAVRR